MCNANLILNFALEFLSRRQKTPKAPSLPFLVQTLWLHFRYKHFAVGAPNFRRFDTLNYCSRFCMHYEFLATVTYEPVA